VTFAPTTAKAEAGTLVISDAVRSQNVSLSGKGLAPPTMTVSPKSLAFASQQINTASAAKTVTVQNTGGAPLGQPNFSFTGPGAGSFQVASGSSTCGATVAPGASCTAQIIFQPLAVGATTATLTIGTSSLGVTPATVALTGTGLSPPMLKVAPVSLDMGQVAVGRSSGLFTVQVTNVGQVSMVGPTFAITGVNVADFELSSPTEIVGCPLPGTAGTLAAGATCSVQVTFSPSVLAQETATLTVTGANAVPGSVSVSMTGTGVPLIQLQANPTLLTFPATVVGQTAATRTVTLSNLGRQNANGLALAVTGPYALVAGSTTCKPTLNAASSCVVGVSFTPTASGDQTGTLTATVTNLGVPALVVNLDGTGQAVGGIAAAPTQMTFGSVVLKTASAVQTLTITNSGQAALAGLKLAVSGDFAVSGNQCGVSLAAGASCTAGVVFTPSATGTRTGTLTASSTSAGVAPTVVGLTGNGIPAGALSASPSVVSFGTVTVGQTSPAQTVQLTNAGATTLAGLKYLLTGDYSLPQNGCGDQLASGAQCSFTVSFSPVAPGTRIGAVTVTSTTVGFTPLVVGLTGSGLPAAQLVVTSPANGTLAFGPVAVGSNSVPLQLIVANPGTGTLTGLSFAAAAPFSVGSGSCGVNLLAGGTCGVPVSFAPTAGGAQAGVVTVSSTSLGVASVTVAATGTGVLAASLRITPASVDFGGVTLGTSSAGQTVTVTNPGGTGLAGLALAFTGTASGDFGLASNGCPATLAAGASCSTVVVFTPSLAGGRQGFLTASSTTKGVATASESLAGTGLTPAVLGVAPSQLTFAATLVGQVSAGQTVTVTNSGQSGIVDLSVGVTAGFRLDAAMTTCGPVLAAGASCVVGVDFAQGVVGVTTGSVTVSSVLAAKAGTAAATVALSGTGALPPGIATAPGGLVQFQTTGLGQKAAPVTVTVTNTGTQSALTGLAAAVDAAGAVDGFGLEVNGCGTASAPASLAAGASCTVDVTFKPTKAGQVTGALVLSSSNGGAPVSLALNGTGFDFLFTGIGSSSATVVRGQTAYFTLAVTPLGGVGGGVFSFGCATVPANSLCLFNPPLLGPLRGTGNVVMGVSTAAPRAARASLSGTGGLAGTLLLVGGVFAVPWQVRRRGGYWKGRKIWAGLWLLAIMIAGVCGVTSCAGSGSGGSGGQGHLSGGTPPGSYPIQVTASSGGISHTARVTLIVN